MTTVKFRDPQAMAERAEAFAESVQHVVVKRARFLERIGTASAAGPVPPESQRALEEALEIVNVQHAELVVAQEELQEQVDELARSLGNVQVERERYRELFEAAPDAYFVTDNHGVVREANHLAASMLGVDPRYMVGKPFAVYLSSESVASFRNALLDTRTESIELSVEIVGRKLGPRAAHIRARRMENGRRILWIARDEASSLPAEIGDLARALRDKDDLLERERRDRERLEREARAKDRFLAILSHDLRAPLNAVLGWTDLLRREILDQSRRERALSTIDRNARSLLGLVEELLDISRITADRLQLDVRPLDLSALVRRVVEAAHPIAREKGIVLGCVVEGDAVVIADAKRIEQIVSNLLGNALKFTPPGGNIDVSVTRADAHARIVMRDSGVGISAATLPHVFDCFRQGEDAGASKGGLGLGLFIVRQIAHLHGGSAHVKSEGDGRGSTFTIELPVADHGPSPAESSHALLPSADLIGVRVLVVDDDEDTRELMTTLVSEAGAHVASAADLEEAKKVIETWSPDAIISDLSMRTHEDGFDVARAARERLGDDVVLIALSGFASERDAARSISAGFDAHLAKPFSAGELVAALVRLREGRALPAQE